MTKQLRFKHLLYLIR